MQTITPELAAILKSKFQAGATGFHGRIQIGAARLYPTTMTPDKSLQSFADELRAEFTNEDGAVGLSTDTFPINALMSAWAWYGDEANAVQVFSGFIDKVSEHRDPRTVSIICRDWGKPLLVQDIATIAPQGVDEAGAVRDATNFVYLNVDVSDIVSDLLDKAGYPAAKRAIQPTNFVVAEWDARDGSSYADAITELADFVAFNAFADELGVFHFQPNGLVDTPSDTDTPPTPVYIFTAGVDILALDPQRDDYDTKTRVKATGPYTTLQDAWTELWHTNVIKRPTGVRYDSATSTYIYVADGSTRKVYKILQSDGSIVSSTAALVPTFLNGLSGDPSDATVYWTLETPWAITGSFAGCKVRKHLKSDDSVVATFNLASGFWTDMKVGADAIWCANFATDQIHKLSKTDGSQITSYTIGSHLNPVGIAIDGTDLYMSFYGESTMLVATTTDPTTIVRTLVFSGTQSLGGDIDTTTHTELYATAAELSLVYKYTLKEPVTNDVSVEVVNDALELALGVALDTDREIRRLMVRLDIVISYAQATEAAARALDKLDQYRNVLDVGIIGNPAIQKGDMVRIVDPVTEIADDFQVDTYRSTLGDTYLGTMALVPWVSSYGGPGTSNLHDFTPDTPIVRATAGAQLNIGGSTDLAIPVADVEGMLYLFLTLRDGATNRATATYYPHALPDTSGPQTMAKLIEVRDATNDSWLAIYRLISPAVSSDSRIHIVDPADNVDMSVAVLVGGASLTTPEGDLDSNSGTGTVSSLTVAAPVGLLLNAASWMKNNVSPVDAPTPAAGQTLIKSGFYNNSFGQRDVGFGVGKGDATPSWDIGDGSRQWLAVSVDVLPA